jgi:hypothetical protein
MRELRLLGADDIVLSTDVPLRRDGLPYADGKWRDPGAAIFFTLRGKPKAIAKDVYNTLDANVRAVGLVIEAMRTIERHGGAEFLDRAFQGFAALPSPELDWRAVLGFRSDAAPTRSEINCVWRNLIEQHHPDRGGDGRRASQINRARDLALQEIGGQT